MDDVLVRASAQCVHSAALDFYAVAILCTSLWGEVRRLPAASAKAQGAHARRARWKKEVRHQLQKLVAPAGAVPRRRDRVRPQARAGL